MHVWCIPDELPVDSATILSDDERRALDRFRLDAIRAERTRTRAGVRLVLSRYAAVAPAAWRFEEGENRRPRLVRAPAVPPLGFNLSHSGGAVVCAVALGREVGVDVEDVRRPDFDLDVFRDQLAPDEAAAVDAAPEGERAERFFRHWTLKEAYAKARSLGLDLPFASVCFEPGDPPRLRGERDWRFAQWTLEPHHVLSAATHARPGEELGFVLREL